MIRPVSSNNWDLHVLFVFQFRFKLAAAAATTTSGEAQRGDTQASTLIKFVRS